MTMSTPVVGSNVIPGVSGVIEIKTVATLELTVPSMLMPETAAESAVKERQPQTCGPFTFPRAGLDFGYRWH